jgi:hypothetical protein
MAAELGAPAKHAVEIDEVLVQLGGRFVVERKQRLAKARGFGRRKRRDARDEPIALESRAVDHASTAGLAKCRISTI